MKAFPAAYATKTNDNAIYVNTNDDNNGLTPETVK